MASVIELWIATGNQGKLNEFKMLLNRVPLQIFAQSALPVFSAPPENGDSFLANARIKTRALRSVKNNHWVMGEDSGLIVDGLGGLPGIHSARYSGPKASEAENTAKLLKMVQIRTATNRKAHFTSVVVAYSPSGEEFIFEGQLSGEIAKAQKGNSGFGYDNVFMPENQTQTLAELGLAFKNKTSHRAKAIELMVEKLGSLWQNEL